MSRATLLSRADLIELLGLMAAEARQRDVHIEMFLVGGGAMALAYNTARMTGDLDGVFEPKEVVYDIAAVVALQSRFELAPDWLNDGVKGFLPGPDDEATVCYEEEGLSVRVGSPRYLFVLKAMASRESDVDDLRLLYRLSGFQSADQALDTVVAAYPGVKIKPAIQFTIEGIAGEVDSAVDSAVEGPVDVAVDVAVDRTM